MAVPPAAAAVIRAALDDYHLTVTPTEDSPARQAHRITEYLVSSGYTLRQTNTRPTGRAGDFGPAAVAALRMALQGYAVLTPPELGTAQDQTVYVTTQLTAAGWSITPVTRTRSATA
ncbi:hypothetical protein [Streptomyces noursei]|uniref:hypothetical protein n=1 Tax=Streptomyces noursei TaxID=1971 RepID=UPI0023B8167A|nr:hypothetical protein [Streptomyces noursei]